MKVRPCIRKCSDIHTQHSQVISGIRLATRAPFLKYSSSLWRTRHYSLLIQLKQAVTATLKSNRKFKKGNISWLFNSCYSLSSNCTSPWKITIHQRNEMNEYLLFWMTTIRYKNEYRKECMLLISWIGVKLLNQLWIVIL